MLRPVHPIRLIEKDLKIHPTEHAHSAAHIVIPFQHHHDFLFLARALRSFCAAAVLLLVIRGMRPASCAPANRLH